MRYWLLETSVVRSLLPSKEALYGRKEEPKKVGEDSSDLLEVSRLMRGNR
jgi:hypothetical protein